MRQLASSRLPACNNAETSEQIFIKFDNLGDFNKICRHIPILIKIGQQYRALNMKAYTRFCSRDWVGNPQGTLVTMVMVTVLHYHGCLVESSATQTTLTSRQQKRSKEILVNAPELLRCVDFVTLGLTNSMEQSPS
jgi:hypothetical protein